METVVKDVPRTRRKKLIGRSGSLRMNKLMVIQETPVWGR
jgi:hypothetical protein